ncbi:MAG: hypothetical protein HUU55_06030 [Myxococcales bacterium]|nr:hypothetical protein [Myxococcales bacterium]
MRFDNNHDPAFGWVLHTGPNQGFHLSAIFDLPTPDDRGIERFSLDLGDFLMLIFENWCPPAAGDPPFVEPHLLGLRLGAAWAAVWFPSDGKVASVTPLFSQPWLRIVSEGWPLVAVDPDHNPLPLAVWPDHTDPPDGDSRWIRLALPSSDTPSTSLVNVKLRPDKAKGGRIRMEITVHADLFVPPLERVGATVRAIHRSLLQGWIEDVCFYYPPVFWQQVGLPEPFAEVGPCAVAERVATRLLQRVENHVSQPRGPRWMAVHRWLEWLQRQLVYKLQTVGTYPAAETILTIARQRLEAT